MDPLRSHEPLVLLVDDDPDVLATLAYMLGSRGFQVLTAGDPAAAMAICRSRPGAVDALVADLSLPGEVPGALARMVAAEFPGVAIVYVSGIPRQIALSQGLVRPDAPYLEKPVEADVLASTVRNRLLRHC
jgi:DNA-binding response OmpR family regulator